MPESSEPIPPKGVDLTRPSVARVYDYYLGGTANWAIDREFGERVLDRFPLVKNIAVANRLFLNRVVRHLAKLGVRQFLDIGAGVPTAGNTHQVADEVAPDTRVVYVDNEPVAVAHGELLLDKEGDPTRHAVIHADLRDPDGLWRDAVATGVLDPEEPVALLIIAVLHVFQPGPDGTDISEQSLARYRELLAPGSYLAISHATDEGTPSELTQRLADLKRMYDTSSSNKVIWRPRAEIDSLFGDFELVEPGTVWSPQWHPEQTGPNATPITFDTPSHAVVWAGVGKKTR
ncbi:SAM-dependent methyltransferase [Actinophytocola sp.]|uniref:SAM-dependent methyltransferase n=1 Tax=Actinophytocola sp. TaxID=1872138 RepID=UPI0025BFC6E0|nr:SAM-dependent methyltransferase [Actinophytocola sp.]